MFSPLDAGALAGVVTEIVKTRRPGASTRQLRSALDNASEPALILKEEPALESEFQIVWANQAFLSLTGYEADALHGTPICILQGPKTSPAVRKQLRAAREAHEPARVECTHYRTDGQAYVALIDLAPLPPNGDTDGYWLSFHHDVTAQRKREDALRYEATHDTLTGLANRAVLREQLQGHLEAAAPALAALLYLDLDRFKLVNDSLGHSKGDQLLVKIARLLQENVREEDTAARIGGDEFAVCLPHLDTPEHAHAVARRIYETLNQPIQLDQRMVFTPASIGMVIGISEYESVEEVLRDADTAMYEAKDDVNRSVAVYDQVMTQKADEQLSLDAELRQGLERNEFVPFFQPILNLSDGSLHGFEVLARWHHPERGLVGPAVFLDAAETTGLIVPIGHQVIRAACQVAHALRHQRGYDFSLSLTANFSRQEFFRAETHTLLTSLFEEYDVRPETFTMEISERTVADISESDVSAFNALKTLGVDILLDDFGTGFSSLQSLRRLPVDGLKIDKDLLTEVNGQAWDRDLIDLVIQIGHTLDQAVTAEGIETPSQLRALRSMGCSYGQGFLFARPLPASQLEALFDDVPWATFWNE